MLEHVRLVVSRLAGPLFFLQALPSVFQDLELPELVEDLVLRIRGGKRRQLQSPAFSSALFDGGGFPPPSLVPGVQDLVVRHADEEASELALLPVGLF